MASNVLQPDKKFNLCENMFEASAVCRGDQTPNGINTVDNQTTLVSGCGGASTTPPVHTPPPTAIDLARRRTSNPNKVTAQQKLAINFGRSLFSVFVVVNEWDFFPAGATIYLFSAMFCLDPR